MGLLKHRVRKRARPAGAFEIRQASNGCRATTDSMHSLRASANACIARGRRCASRWPLPTRVIPSSSGNPWWSGHATRSPASAHRPRAPGGSTAWGAPRPERFGIHALPNACAQATHGAIRSKGESQRGVSAAPSSLPTSPPMSHRRHLVPREPAARLRL